MAVTMRPVFSSHITHIGYGDGELHVAYKNGKKSIYDGVPADVANGVLGAPSIGTAIHATVRGKYEHRYAE